MALPLTQRSDSGLGVAAKGPPSPTALAAAGTASIWERSILPRRFLPLPDIKFDCSAAGCFCRSMGRLRLRQRAENDAAQVSQFRAPIQPNSPPKPREYSAKFPRFRRPAQRPGSPVLSPDDSALAAATGSVEIPSTKNESRRGRGNNLADPGRHCKFRFFCSTVKTIPTISSDERGRFGRPLDQILRESGISSDREPEFLCWFIPMLS